MTHLWHPCTQMHTHLHTPPLAIARAEGAYLYTRAGQPLLDTISSWWVNLHGHSHVAINSAINLQLGQFSQVMLAGLTHEGIEQLAKSLVALTPPPLQRVFFADSGSAAVEVALKMSLQYWAQTEGTANKRYFISLQNGYHGETLGSLSVTDIPLFSAQYQPLLVQQLRAPSPASNLASEGCSASAHEQHCLTAMQALLEQHEGQVCAIIVEPLVQGAAGMQMYSPSYLQGLAELRTQFGVHLIFDEIAVGFGRTGKMFALEHTATDGVEVVCPDFLCLSKGLTAGYLPMSAVLTTNAVYDAFYSSDVRRGFLHSHSFTGNALAAAAANASLALFASGGVWAQQAALIPAMQLGLAQLASKPWARDCRGIGLIGAISVVNPSNQQPMGDAQRSQLVALMLEHGYWTRPIGHHVYCMPPYCTTPSELLGYWATLGSCIDYVILGTPWAKPAVYLP